MPVTINGTTGITTPDLDSTADITANSVPFGKGAGSISTNIAIGGASLAANTTGTNNLACGVNALDSNTTGTDNIALGNSAGQAVVTASGNVFIGSNAGAFTTGVENTFIGSGVTGVDGGAGFYITTGTKNTILGKFDGNQNGLDIRTASNYIVLSDGDGNPRQVIDNNGTSKLKQYLVANNKKDAVPSGSATNLFRLTSPTGQIYGPLTIQFAYDQPGVNLYVGTITGRAFWNGGTALYDNTTTTGNTVTWSVTGSGNDLTFRVTQGTGANVNFSYTVIWTQYQTGGLSGVDTTTIVGL
jgi:hypothetical protein